MCAANKKQEDFGTSRWQLCDLTYTTCLSAPIRARRCALVSGNSAAGEDGEVRDSGVNSGDLTNRESVVGSDVAKVREDNGKPKDSYLGIVKFDQMRAEYYDSEIDKLPDPATERWLAAYRYKHRTMCSPGYVHLTLQRPPPGKNVRCG